jgi:hypothetical protein
MGSSPVEQKAIESKENELNLNCKNILLSIDSILVNQYVREQKRILKTAPKGKRNSGKGIESLLNLTVFLLILGYHPSSSTVGPVNVLSSYGACQPCGTLQKPEDFDYSQQRMYSHSIIK